MMRLPSDAMLKDETMTKRIGMKRLHAILPALALVLFAAFLSAALLSHTPAPRGEVSESVEAGFSSLSPRGEAGGSIVPASCESGYEDYANQCNYFSINPNPIDYGGYTNVSYYYFYTSYRNSPPYCNVYINGGLAWGGAPTAYTWSNYGPVYANQPWHIDCYAYSSVFFGGRLNLVWQADGTIYVNPPPSCTNGATNPPTCTQCSAGSVYVGGSCVASCTNGATNPPACNQCSAGYAYLGGSCTACSNGGCSGTGGSLGNPYGGLSCNNGARNPVACSAFIPTATLSATPSVVDRGQSSTLTWNSTNSTSCTGTGFSTGGATSGSVSTGILNTAGTQSYQLVCSGTGGSTQPTFASVEVLNPSATISANPSRVQAGGSAVLTWSASGVSSCSVTGPSGTLVSGAANASHAFSTGSPRTVTITAQSTYTITCQTNSTPVTRSIIVNTDAAFQEF